MERDDYQGLCSPQGDTETIILAAVERQRMAARELERLVALSQERSWLLRNEDFPDQKRMARDLFLVRCDKLLTYFPNHGPETAEDFQLHGRCSWFLTCCPTMKMYPYLFMGHSGAPSTGSSRPLWYGSGLAMEWKIHLRTTSVVLK